MHSTNPCTLRLQPCPFKRPHTWRDFLLHLLSSVEIRTGDLLLGRPDCASQLANKSFKVTADRITCQQLS